MNWEQELLVVAIVYRMAECGDKIPMMVEGTKWEFVDDVLNKMYSEDLIEISADSQEWLLAEDGKKLLTRMVGMLDQSMKFEVFGHVNLTKELTEEILDAEGDLLPHVHDPRFSEEAMDGTEDLRLAMMSALSDQFQDAGKLSDPLDPRRIVFLHRLSQGKYESEDFWKPSNLEAEFEDIEKVAIGSYHWTDLGEDDDESWELAQVIYTAGMLEVRKREGHVCSNCDAPLGLVDEDADECPGCGASFGTEDLSASADYECPHCHSSIFNGQSVCQGCGARIDFGLPSGTVQSETVTETVEEVDDYGMYYGYDPYPWYSPYDPYADALAFGLLCGMMW